MTMLMKLEDEVKNLQEKDFAKFRDWFLSYESEEYDNQIKNDSKLGKLDNIVQLAINDKN